MPAKARKSKHTQANAHTQTHTNTHTHTNTQPHTNTHKHTNTQTHKHTNTHTQHTKQTQPTQPTSDPNLPRPGARRRRRRSGRGSKGRPTRLHVETPVAERKQTSRLKYTRSCSYNQLTGCRLHRRPSHSELFEVPGWAQKTIKKDCK